MKQTNRPLLSIGMIIKNEAKYLESCLCALDQLRREIPCELVIADTGSTDGSRAVAERYADVLFDFTWVNDFSAARNAVMDRCKGKWYLTIDADEILDESIAELCAFLRSQWAEKATAALVYQRNYTDPKLPEDYSDFWVYRLLRMDSELRYQGAIHESWDLPTGSVQVYLHGTILHHYGYQKDDDGRLQEKKRRNLALLEEELRRNPEDLRRMLQMLESAANLREEVPHARAGVELVRRHLGEPETTAMGAAIYRMAAEAAARNDMPERDQWIREACELFPTDPLTMVDVRFVILRLAYVEERYEKLLVEADQYWAGLRALKEMETLPPSLLLSPLRFGKESNRNWASLAVIEANAHLERWEEAKRLLCALPLECFDPQNIENILMLASMVWEHADLTDLFYDVGRRLLDPACEDQRTLQQRNALRNAAVATFYPDEKRDAPAPPYPLMAQWDCDVGLAAGMMCSDNQVQAQALAGAVVCWNEVPAPAVERLLCLGCSLPEGFYQRNAEAAAALGAALSQHAGHLAHTILGWEEKCAPSRTLSALLLRTELAAAAARQEDAWTEREEGLALYALLRRLGTELLERLYCPEALSGEGVSALPGTQRFCWHLLRAQEALESGDPVGYVQRLRAGLQSVPEMSGAVKFLTRELQAELKPRPPENSELLLLAQQVRKKLDQMRAVGDPGVEALLSSPAYQKLRPLIEQLEQP